MGNFIRLPLLIGFCISTFTFADSDVYTPEQICESWMPASYKKSQNYGNHFQSCKISVIACQREESTQAACLQEVYQDIQDNAPQSAAATTAAATADPGTTPTTPPSKLVSDCKSQNDDTVKFCRNPMSAASDGAVGGGLTQMGMQLGLGVGSMVAQQNSMKAYCDLMKYSGGTVSGLNAALSAQCLTKINSCEKACDIKGDTLKDFANSFNERELSTLREELSQCRQMNSQASMMAASATQALNGFAQGKLCGDIVNSNNNIPPRDPMDPLAPPPNANCATDPTNPFCRQVGGTPTGGPTSGGGGSNLGIGEKFNVGGDLPDGIEPGFDPGGAPSQQVSNPGIANGGGGGLPGGGGNGSFGGDDNKARGPGKGYDTNIMQGERGGGGYSSGAGGGGWSGYGKDEQQAGRKGDSAFDLSKYLPGQEKAANRGPAGLSGNNAGIGKIGDDIFKKMSDRIYATCMSGSGAIRLRDCTQ